MTGIYCYYPDVFRIIGTLVPSGRGELEITDVNNWYVDQENMDYDILDGFWGDAGRVDRRLLHGQRLRPPERRQQKG